MRTGHLYFMPLDVRIKLKFTQLLDFFIRILWPKFQIRYLFFFLLFEI